MSNNWDQDIFVCVICATSLASAFDRPTNEQRNFRQDITSTFLKLFGIGTEIEIAKMSSKFEEFPDLLCYSCLCKVELVHNTFLELEKLQEQIKLFREQFRKQLVDNYNSRRRLINENGQFKKSDVIRIQIMEGLNLNNLESDNPILHAKSLQEQTPQLQPIDHFNNDMDGCNHSDSGHQPPDRCEMMVSECKYNSPILPPGVVLKDLRINLQRIDTELELKIKKLTKCTRKKKIQSIRKKKIQSIRFRILRNQKPVLKNSEIEFISPDFEVDNTSTEVEFEIPGQRREDPENNSEYSGDEHDLGGFEGDSGGLPDGGDSDFEDSTTKCDPDPDLIPRTNKKKNHTPEHLLIKCPKPGCKSKVRYNAERLQAHTRLVHDGILLTYHRKPQQKRKYPLLKCTYPDCKSKVRFSAERLKGHVNRVHLGIIPSFNDSHLKACPEPGCPSKVRFTKERLVGHIRRVHQKILEKPRHVQCDLCGKVLSNEKILESHRRKHTGERLTCEMCGAQFRTKLGLSDHKTTRHESRDKHPYACEICGKTFLRENIFNIHKQRHSPDRPFSCQVCPRDFVTKHELSKHEKFFHAAELNLESVKCKICGKVCISKSILRIHIRTTHKGEFRYPCTICDYKTDRNNDLKEHMITHSTEIPFNCEECGKGFKLKRRLDEHKRSHQVDYPFECSVCHKRFSKNSFLVKHEIMSHSHSANKSKGRSRNRKQNHSNNNGEESVVEVELEKVNDSSSYQDPIPNLSSPVDVQNTNINFSQFF